MTKPIKTLPRLRYYVRVGEGLLVFFSLLSKLLLFFALFLHKSDRLTRVATTKLRGGVYSTSPKCIHLLLDARSANMRTLLAVRA